MKTDVIDPSTEIFHSEQNLKHRFHVLERTIVGIILYLRTHHKGILRPLETAGDDFDREVRRSDGEKVGTGVESESSDGCFCKVALACNDPAILLIVEVADGERVARGPHGELPGTGSPPCHQDR